MGLLNGQEHRYEKIDQKSISVGKFQSLMVVIVPAPDLDKIPC